MNCIAIDSTTDKLYMALLSDKGDFYAVVEVGKAGLSRAIMPEIDKFLASSGVDKRAVDIVAANVGPGSFTGIRIGVSAMTAAAFALGAKRIGVTTFDMLAYNRQKADVAADAGHGNCYVAAVDGGKVESMGFIENFNADPRRGEYVFDTALPREKALAEVVRRKISDGDFCAALEPFYLRKSQAEREKDEV